MSPKAQRVKMPKRAAEVKRSVPYVDPLKTLGSKPSGTYVDRTVSGVPYGNVHRVAVLEDGTLAERTLCGSWPSPSKPGESARSACPTCAKHEMMGTRR